MLQSKAESKKIYLVTHIDTKQSHTIMVHPRTNNSKPMFEYIFFNNIVGNQVGRFTFNESQFSNIKDLNINTSSYTYLTKGKFVRDNFPEYFI